MLMMINYGRVLWEFRIRLNGVKIFEKINRMEDGKEKMIEK